MYLKEFFEKISRIVKNIPNRLKMDAITSKVILDLVIASAKSEGK